MCGMGVGEYIRARRLTLAGEELAHSDSKVIDIAAKYGYDSPDSFNRAFQRFHGISPSSARKTGAALVSFAPMKIKLELEGDTWMWQEWLPNCREYKLSGSYNLEVYSPPCKEDPGETYVELWLPVERR